MAASQNSESFEVPKGLFINWSKTEVAEWLLFKGTSNEVANIFKEQNINGELLSSKYFWDHEKLARMGIASEGDRQLCLDFIEELREDLHSHKSKTFKDPLHGPVEIHPLLVRIIDTPQFQRLRDIKQLGKHISVILDYMFMEPVSGGVYYVFPGASHNRFEHSIGVCHLAGLFMENLRRMQPELRIDDCDVLCVKIAALCHDMGHGPFSYFFQELFIPEIYSGLKWTHEEASVKLMDYMMEVNEGLRDMFKYYGFDWERERIFIHELILGVPLQDNEFQGRDKAKHFLYEIVANRVNFIDVDKIDSLLRDAQALGIAVHFDWRKYIRFCRVVTDDTGQSHICPRDKEVREVYEFCNFRDYLFQAVYQHRTKRAVELMILKAMKKANNHLRLPGKGGNLVKISETIGDMEAFTRLTDGILHTIAVYTPATEDLLKARKILEEIQHRRLYMFVGKTLILEPKQKSRIYELDLQGSIVDKCSQLNLKPVPKEEKLLAELVKFDFGFNKKKSIDQIWFYQRAFPSKPVTIRKRNVPRRIEEWELRVYYSKYDLEARDVAQIGFYEVCKSEGFTGLFKDVESTTVVPPPPPPTTNNGESSGGNCCIS